MTEDGSRTHEFSTPRRVNVKNSKKTSQSLAELSEQSGKSKTLYLIRHANKSCHHDHSANLCAAGVYRADHLKDVFNGKQYKSNKTTFKTPEHIFAYMYDEKTYKTTQRCHETVVPIAASLNGKWVHKIEHSTDKINKEGAKDILSRSESGFRNKNVHVVLAAWEHAHMEEMAYYLGMNSDQHNKLGHGHAKKDGPDAHKGTNSPGTGKPHEVCDPPWPADTNFDYVYTFVYDKSPYEKPSYIHCHKQGIHISPDLYHPSHTNPCLYDASDKNTKHTCY